MTWTLKLDSRKRDLIINSDGKFERITGSNEVVQRIDVALNHYIEEYFINIPNGVPWYEEILGAKGGSSKISNILRTKILSVPGVVQIVSFRVNYNGVTRAYTVSSSVLVESGPGEPNELVTINGIDVVV